MIVQRILGRDIRVYWNSPKLIIVASDYSRYDKHAVNVINRNISLYKFYLYENDMLYIERINTDSIGEIDEQAIPAFKKTENGNTLEALQSSSTDDVINVFNELKERILASDDSISEKITSVYVAYRASKNFAEIWFKNKFIQCQLLSPEKDDKNIGKKVPDSYRWTLNYRVDIKSLADINDAMELIEKSYNKTK